MEELRSRLERSADPEALRELVAEAKSEDRRPEAVAFLKGLYGRRRSLPLYEALRELCTFTELQTLPLPEAQAVGRYGEQLLSRGRYRRHLKSVYRYPFSSRTSRWVIFLGGPFFAAAQVLLGLDRGLFMILPALVLGYFLAYGFTVVRESIEGRVKAPGWPDEGWIGEYLLCFFRWWMATAVSFFPALMALSLWASTAETAGSSAVFAHPLVFIAAGLGLAGLFYYPMAILMAASFESGWAPLKAVRGFRSIRSLGTDYLLCWGAFMLLAVLGSAVQWAAVEATVSVSWWIQSLVEIPVSWFLLALLIVQMRMLGLLCYARRDDLGWFR